MLDPWISATMLAAEACQIIALRMLKMSFGGQGALDEASLMVTEKIAASWEAVGTLVTGGSGVAVLERYRHHVACNAGRLNAR